MVTGSVMNAVATSEMVLGNIYTLKNIQEVESLGINAEYDEANKLLVYERLRRFCSQPIHNGVLYAGCSGRNPDTDGG